MSQTRIVEGRVLCLFAFDVASAIELASIPSDLRPERARIAPRRPAPEYVGYANPPVEISLGEQRVGVGGRSAAVSVTARLFDFGAVSISWSLPMPDTLGDLPGVAQALAAETELGRLARRLLEGLVERIAPCLERPGLNDLVEDFFVFQIAALDPPWDAETLLRENAPLLAAALTMDAGPLARRQVEELVGEAISYYGSDLVLLDWNAALIFDREWEDTVAVLEELNVRLVELRFLDLRLDRALGKFSAEVYRPPFGSLRAPHRTAIRALSELTVETLRLSEQVQNALKLIPDVYLARVHRRGAARLGLPAWEAMVRAKLEAVRQLITVLSERASVRRAEAMELAIILLIALEIALALFGWMGG